MALTYSAGVITITGAKDTGTATSGTATTLADTSKSWTTNEYAGSFVWIYGGTGSGQTRLIISNTATTLTIHADHEWETNPSTDSTYRIGYTFEDLYDEDVANTWGVITKMVINSSSVYEQSYQIDSQIRMSSSAFLADARKSISLESANDPAIRHDSGTLFQLGALANGTPSDNLEDFGIYGCQLYFRSNDANGNGGLGANYHTNRFAQTIGSTRLYGSSIYGGRTNLYEDNVNGLISNSQSQHFVDTKFDQPCQVQQGTGSVKLLRVQAPWFNQMGNEFDLAQDLISFPYDSFEMGIYAWSRFGSQKWTDHLIKAGPNADGLVQIASNNASAGEAVVFLDLNPQSGDVTVTYAGSGSHTPGSSSLPVEQKTSWFPYTRLSGTYETGIAYRVTDTNGTEVVLDTNTGTLDPHEILWREVVYNNSATTYNDFTIRLRKYGIVFQEFTRPLTSVNKYVDDSGDLRKGEAVVVTSNPFVVAASGTVAAYSGIALDGAAKTITVTTSHTIQEIYDYSQYWAATESNVQYDEPISTIDGNTFTLETDWDLIVSGSGVQVTDATKTIVYQGTGALTVSSGGFFEDSTGGVWANGASTYYLKHVYRNVKDVSTSTNQQYAVVACWDTDSNTDVTYNTSLVNGGLTTDASGNIEGYYAYKVDSTTYTLTEYIGLYGFNWSTVPIPSNGTVIGASGAGETIRLVTDPYVTLTRTNALAVSGVTVTHGVDEINFNSNSHSQVQDNLKARQASASDIETGKAGYVSYYEEGALFSYNGTLYTLHTDWTAQNIADTTETLKGGTVELGTAGDINFNFDSLTIDYTTAGTYDHRLETMDGTITLVNSSGEAVTVQLDPTVSFTNTGPNITVDASVAVTTSLNSVDSSGSAQNWVTGTRIQIYNSSGAAASAWQATTAYSEGQRVLRTTGAGTEDGAGGTAAGLWFECTTAGTTGGTEPTWNTTEGSTTTDGTVVWTCRVIELYNDTPSTSVSTVSVNYTYLADATFRYRIIAIDGTTAYSFEEGTISVTSSGGSANTTQTTNSIYENNLVDGSTVTECSIASNGIDIQVSDSDNTTTFQRIYAWYQYYLSTEAGIRDATDYITAETQTSFIYDDTVEIKNTKTGSPLAITGGNAVDSSGDPIGIFDTTGETIFTNSRTVVPFNYVSGSGVTAQDKTDIISGVWNEDVSGYTTTDTAGEVLVKAKDKANLSASLSA